MNEQVYEAIVRARIEVKLKAIKEYGNWSDSLAIELQKVNLGDTSLYEFLEYVDRIELIEEVDGNI